jgi:Ca2+-binding EF-hand superfamily protein
MPAGRWVRLAIFPGLLIGSAARPSRAQDPPVKPPPDEFRALVKAVEAAYRPPLEVDKDILSELRKQYRDPKPDREEKILRAVRRAYHTTPSQEEAILRAVRRAAQEPSADREARVLEEVRRGGALTPGTISPEAQLERAAKMFRNLDRNKDGVLGPGEMPEFLRSKLRDWDRNGDGAIDASEYLAYFQASLKWVAEQVASGAIPIKMPKGAAPTPPAAESAGKAALEKAAPVNPAPPGAAGPRVQPQPQLPEWFAKLDEDGDGQVGLYEWKKAGRPVSEFLEMDRNHDGFLEVRELLAYLAEHPSAAPDRRRR